MHRFALLSSGFLGTAVLLAVGCGPSDHSTCAAPSTRGDLPDDRAIELGTLAPVAFGEDAGVVSDRFTPYVDGSDQELVFGFQGGFMLLPVVRVSAGSSTAPTECFHVDLQNTIDGGVAVEDGLRGGELLDRVGDSYYSGQLFNLLSLDLDPLIGRTLTMQVTVTGRDFKSTSRSVSVVLRPPT